MLSQKQNIEESLIQQIINGDADAYTAVYELYKDRIFAFAYSLTKSKDIAEETVQEVFLRLWEKRSQIKLGTSFTAYIKAIAYNHIIDFFRQVKRSAALKETLQENMETLRNTNEEVLISKNLELLYKHAIELLPPQKKRVYLLGRDGCLSYDEIAAEMNISKNTVRNHMTEAIRLIRQYISMKYLPCLIGLFVILRLAN